MTCRRRQDLLSAVAGPLPSGLRRLLLRRAGLWYDPSCVVFPGLRIAGDAGVRLGPRVFISYDAYLDCAAGIEIRADAEIGDHVRIITSQHEIGPRDRRSGRPVPRAVVVGAGTWIGSGVTILPGVTVGDGCVIAAGSVVTRDCELDRLYAGVPARAVRRLGA